ncbi:MAG: hypothetical protein EBZ44_07730 [Verrucomicrobia bacterium]|nr:hypothetical protein [Verrucomicrobiota bacterium]
MEVVLAMGVATLAFTTIIALFPVGLNLSKETHEETQAALIAQSLLSDLRDDYIAASVGSWTNRKTPGDARVSLALMSNVPMAYQAPTSVVYIGFTNHTVGSITNPNELSQTGALVLRPSSRHFAIATTTNLASAPAWYQNGVARVVIRYTFQIVNPGGSMSLADIRVETPGNAAASNRAAFSFSGGFR